MPTEIAMIALKVTTIEPALAGSSGRVVLPQEALDRFNVAEGDTLYLTDAPDGGMRLTSHDPETERQAAIIEDIMHKDRHLLAALAKV